MTRLKSNHRCQVCQTVIEYEDEVCRNMDGTLPHHHICSPKPECCRAVSEWIALEDTVNGQE